MDAPYLLYRAPCCKDLQIHQHSWSICRCKSGALLECVWKQMQLQQYVLSHGASTMCKGLRQSYASCEAGIRFWRSGVLEVSQWNLTDFAVPLLEPCIAGERPTSIHYTWHRYNVAQGFTKWRTCLHASLCKYYATWCIFYATAASQWRNGGAKGS